MFATALDVKALAAALCTFSRLYELGCVVFLRGSGHSGGAERRNVYVGRKFVEVD